MMREYSSGLDNAKCIAANGLIQANTATIIKGKTIRIPKTAIKIPQVKKRRCQTGVISTSLLAFTIALSNDSAISKAAKTAPTIRNDITADILPWVAHPSHPDKLSPITVVNMGHLR